MASSRLRDLTGSGSLARGSRHWADLRETCCPWYPPCPPATVDEPWREAAGPDTGSDITGSGKVAGGEPRAPEAVQGVGVEWPAVRPVH